MNEPPRSFSVQQVEEPIEVDSLLDETRQEGVVVKRDLKWFQQLSVSLIILLLLLVAAAGSLILLLKPARSQCTLFNTGENNGASSINSAITNAISQVTTDLSRRYVEEKIWTQLSRLNLTLRAALLDFDAENLSQLLKQYYYASSTPRGTTSTSTEPTTLARQMETSFWKPAGFPLPTKLGSFLEKQELDLECLEKSSGVKQERHVKTWAEPLRQFEEIQSSFNEWFQFCWQLESKVNSYAFQKKKPPPPRPTPQDASDWLAYIEKHDILKVDSRIKQVASKMGERERSVVGDVLNFALEPPRTSCESQPHPALVISGNFLVLSQIVPKIPDLVASCETPPTQIEFHAGHTLFLDADINLKQLDVSILAPNWVEVARGSSPWTILLEGNDGGGRGSHPQNKSAAISRRRRSESDRSWTEMLAAAGFHSYPLTADRGKDGCAGMSGEPGGSLFGIVSKVNVSSTKKLVISSKGGNGGPGQNGGRGADGKARDASFPEGGRGTPDSFVDKPDHDEYQSLPLLFLMRIVRNYGVTGQNGGDGGNGGLKGVGGAPGSTTVIQLETAAAGSSNKAKTLLEYVNTKGTEGAAGDGGAGASGASVGKGYYCTALTMAGLTDHHDPWECSKTEPSRGRGPGKRGKDGSAGTSSSCLVPPEPPRKMEEWRSMLAYKLTFFNNTEKVTVDFIRHVDTSPETNKLVPLKALAEESLALEKVDRSSANPARLRDMYFALIGKLEEHSKLHHHTSSSSPEEQKVIGILLTSLYSSVMNMRGGGPLGVGVVLDVTRYFALIKEEINSLKTATAVVSIRKEKEGFVRGLQEKIGQTTRFIKEVVTPAMVQAGSNVESRLGKLERELMELVLNSKLNLQECKLRLRRAEAAQELLKFNQIFGVIAGLATAGSALIPGVGPAFATWGSTVKKMGGTLAQNPPEDVERLKELVKEAERLVEEVEEKRKHFQTEFAPMINSLLNYFENVSQALSKGEQIIAAPQLGVTKWQLVGKLKDAKTALEDLCDDSLNDKPLVHAFDRLQDAMTLMTDLYEMIDHYLEVQSMAEYIADVNSAALNPVPIKDPDLARAVENFDKKLRENMVEAEVGKAMHAFRQWVFPFAKYYLHPLPPTTTQPSEVGSAQLRQVEQLHAELEKYKSMSVSGQDTFIRQTNFSSGFKSSKPFFTWKKETFGTEIQALLSGSKVHLNADVRQSGMPGRDAIKFKLIEIHLKLDDNVPPSLQNEFDEVIDYFGVSMTHSGVSHYRFQNEVYSMTGENQTLKFNFERDSKGDRLGTNEIYEKFKKGDYLLSPYSLWTIQLSNAAPEEKGEGRRQVDFSSLKRFAPQVDIELVGIGTWVDAEEAVKGAGGDLQLDKYYQRDDSYRPQFQL